MKTVLLPPISEGKQYWDALEARLRRWFKQTIYYPILRELDMPNKVLKNAAHPNALMDALYRGQVTFNRGTFSGKFDASISKVLRELGATFNRKEGTYKIALSELPQDIKNVISASDAKFTEKLTQLDKKIATILPEEIAAKFKSSDLFDKALWKSETEFQKNVKNITVTPKLTDEQRVRVAEEWSDNMKLWIQGWTETEIKSLRKKIQDSTFKGNRYGNLVKSIQDSYGVSQDKAHFLARQETRLLMGTFQQTRYEAAGSPGYFWRCVKRPKDENPKTHTPGNVRYQHGKLDGTEQKWSSPPIVSNPGQPTRRAHPGMDFRCRCYAQVVMRLSG